ncbi:MAG: AAA family ATPase [Calothrix sp. FI2-JRJ7]|nr:AAA family ATPase [Calothrix sp. FI2-JRJ7]
MSNNFLGEEQNPIIQQSLLNNNNVGRNLIIDKIEQQITNNWNTTQPNKLGPLHREIFKPLIESRLALFGGRDTILVQIAKFINQATGGYLVIIAPAGFGKTSLIAKLVIEAPEKFAYHFFAPYENPNSVTEEGFLRNVVEQMALWHGYTNSLPKKLTDLQALYHNLLDKPLNSTHVLAIDGLDEVVNWKIAPHLSRRLPDNLHIILTIRDVGQDLAVDYDFPNNQTDWTLDKKICFTKLVLKSDSLMMNMQIA